MLKRAVANDTLQAIAMRFFRAGHSSRRGHRQDLFRLDIFDTRSRIHQITGLYFPADGAQRVGFASASTLVLINFKGKRDTGLVHAEAL